MKHWGKRIGLLLVVLTLGLRGTPARAIPPPGFLGIVTILEDGTPAGWVPVAVVPLSDSQDTVPIEGTTNAHGQLWLSLAPGRYRVFVEGNQHRAPTGDIVSNGEVILWITVVVEES